MLNLLLAKNRLALAIWLLLNMMCVLVLSLLGLVIVNVCCCLLDVSTECG